MKRKNSSLIELALKELNCSQKVLARKLDITEGQISRWKNHNEDMSSKIRNKIYELLNLRINDDPDVIRITGSAENAYRWSNYIKFIANYCLYNDEDITENYQIQDWEDNFMTSKTLDVLEEMGVEIPSTVPDSHFQITDDIFINNIYEDYEDEMDIILKNPIGKILYDIFQSYLIVQCTYDINFSDIYYDNKMSSFIENDWGYHSSLLFLAAAKIDANHKIAKNFKKYKLKWIWNYGEWVRQFKTEAIKQNIPLSSELMRLVIDNPDEEIGKVKYSNLGINDARILDGEPVHPDIYMNELLVSMRTINKVLPLILKKLGIDKEISNEVKVLKKNIGNKVREAIEEAGRT